MEFLYKKPLFLLTCFLVFFFSCEIDNSLEEPLPEEPRERKRAKNEKIDRPSSNYVDNRDIPQKNSHIHENLGILLPMESPASTECAPTALAPILGKHLYKLLQDPLAEENYDRYSYLSFNVALFDQSPQYFGKNGEATKLVQKRIRELEKFWKMPGELRVNGQHSESLEDRDKVAQAFYNMMMDDSTWDDAYESADNILELNERSPMLPESPIFSTDGFLTYSNLIVIGDGLVQMLSETGIEEEIVWTGVLAHEWVHQIQLDQDDIWYANKEFGSPAERARHLELEADFFASYYMTHKRGATYNWKRVEQFFDLFFQLGDCNFNRSDHHGTPDQRMHASRLGYELANTAQKKGHILSENAVHEAFLAEIDKIIN